MRGLIAEDGLDGEIEVESAGTGDWHLGEPPDPRSVAAAAERGVELTGAARQVTEADFEGFDLLVAMDRSNRDALLRLAPDAEAREKVRLLREFDGDAQARRRARSLLRRGGGVRRGRGDRRAQLPRAARRSSAIAVSAARPTLARSAPCGSRVRRRGLDQRRLAGRAGVGRRRVREVAPGRRVGGLRGGGGRACAGWRAPTRCRSPRCSASAARSRGSPSSGSSRAPSAGRSGAARPRARGAPPRRGARSRGAAAGCAGRHPPASARSSSIAERAAWPRAVRRGPAAAAGARARDGGSLTAGDAAAVRVGVRRGSRGWRVRRSSRRAYTATCGAATSSAGATDGLADRPGRLRRPPRDRPGDAAAVRRAERADLRRLRRGVSACRGARGAGRALAAPAAAGPRRAVRRLVRAGAATRPAATLGARLRRREEPTLTSRWTGCRYPVKRQLRRRSARRFIPSFSAASAPPCQVGRRVRGSLDAGVAERCDVLVARPVRLRAPSRFLRSAGRVSRIACSSTPSSEPWSRSSSAAVFSPTPLAPGIPSDGSPRSAMKSGTSSGPIP